MARVCHLTAPKKRGHVTCNAVSPGEAPSQFREAEGGKGRQAEALLCFHRKRLGQQAGLEWLVQVTCAGSGVYVSLS